MTGMLDDPNAWKRIDVDGSYERIHGLPEQCLEAWRDSKDLALPAGYSEVDKIAVVGMGGSAIAGDFLQAICFDEGSMPVSVLRGYDLPKWVDARTLVIACSHSGNTEEVLSAFEQAMATPARKLVITTGGELREVAAEHGIPVYAYSYPNVPRDAFGHAYMRLLAAARALGAIAIDDGRITRAVAAMGDVRRTIESTVPEALNAAKQTAHSLDGLLPFIVGGGFMGPVARRWRTQLNENADVFAVWDELPELDHNLVVGMTHPAEMLASTRAVFLDHESLHPRIRLRYGLTIEIFERHGISCERLDFSQPDRLAGQLCAVFFGDLVSYYLAMLKGTRPVEIDNINWLKEKLAAE